MLFALAAATSLSAAPPESMPPGFVHLREVVREIVEDMRYAGPHNFTGAPVEGYDAPVCILTREAATALKQVAAEMSAKGYVLMVWDCYRPARAVAAFVRWASGSDDSMQSEFYPRVPRGELFDRGYIASRSRHSAGSTLDLTLVPAGTQAAPSWQEGTPLVDCAAPFGTRFADGGIDMGTGHDCFDVKSHLDGDVGAAALANRKILYDAMMAAGFEGYQEEWWHFSLKDEPHKGEVFDFPVR